MRIVIASPLYPPDIADPAPYVKELARRLSQKVAVSIVTYGRIPEVVPGVTIYCADKRQSTFLRLCRFTLLLWRATKGARSIYLQSGMSAELPALLVSVLRNTKLLYRISAEPEQDLLRRSIRNLTMKLATRVDTTSALVRPEVLPLEPHPTAEMERYEHAWGTHCETLIKIL